MCVCICTERVHYENFVKNAISEIPGVRYVSKEVGSEEKKSKFVDYETTISE